MIDKKTNANNAYLLATVQPLVFGEMVLVLEGLAAHVTLVGTLALRWW